MLGKVLYCLTEDLKYKPFKTLDQEAYIGDILILKGLKNKYRSWSYYILETDEPDIYKIYYLTGIIGGKSYPITSVGTLVRPAYVGRKNEVSSLTRALKTAESDTKKKLDSGYTSIKEANIEVTYELINDDIKYAPIPEQFKPKSDVLNFPYWASIKYDGACLICCYHNSFESQKDNILMYTRNRKLGIGFYDLREALLPALKKYPGLFVVGELYKHGYARNLINSVHSTNLHGTKTEIDDMNYVIFDCFYAFESTNNVFKTRLTAEDILKQYNEIIVMYNLAVLKGDRNNLDILKKYNNILDIGIESAKDVVNFLSDFQPPNMIYSQRQTLLKDLVKNCEGDKVMLAETHLVSNNEELQSFYNDVLKQGYEGLVMRKDTQYLYSFKKKRINPHNFKLKPFDDDEFKVVGFKLGKGKASKNVIFICDISHLAGPGIHLNVTMNINEEEMAVLYQDVVNNFKAKYMGKMLTVKYEKISDKGVPLFPKGLTFREDVD